jgi:DNA-binding response OmpR family regulator
MRFLIFDLAPPSRSRNRATVLIVEDDTLIAEMYRLALVRAGYEVVVAPNGEIGLERARTAAPDFAFLDVKMPRMDGIELLRRLAEDGAAQRMPIVMLTNFDDAAQLRASLALGAKDYIIKTSIAPGDLPGIVSRWLEAA